MKLAAVLVVALGCAPRAMPLTADHPAHPDAPSGRLAGPPAALRPGVANIEPIQPASTPRSQPAPPVEDHSQHAPEPEPQSKTPATPKPKPKPKAPAKPKPTPAPAQPPAHQGHQGHEGHH